LATPRFFYEKRGVSFFCTPNFDKLHTKYMPEEIDQLTEVEQLRAENARLRAENKSLAMTVSCARRLIETNIIGIVVFEVTGKVIEVNDMFAHILGYTSEEFKQQTIDWQRFVPQSEWAAQEERICAMYKNGSYEPWETLFLRTDGVEVPVITAATLARPALTEGEDHLPARCVLWAFDISAWKRTQNELKESEALLRAIVEGLHEGVMITDLDDVVLYINQRMCEISGYSKEEFIGKPAYKVLLPPSQWSIIEKENQQRVEGISRTYEIEMMRKDGSIWWALVNGSPLRDSAGQIIGTIGAQSDITQNKLSVEETNAFAKKLERSNHELQTFAYAVSHDLKEPLRKIEVFGSRLERNEGDKLSAESRDYLRRMRNAASRMFGLIDGLLDYSRVSTAGQPLLPVDLEKIFRAVISDLEIAIERVEATVEATNLPVVNGDAVQLRQLLQNLISNSLRYSREGVRPHILVEGWSHEGECGFSVQDNGQGFEQRDAEKIFDIFSRLEPKVSDGSGVGLTICRKIVERHSGVISATGVPDQGATFSVKFPLCSS
jgi:two-component system sensor kinase FixL